MGKTANRPSQSDQQYVTNSKGEKVRNLAYKGKKKNKETGSYNSSDIMGSVSDDIRSLSTDRKVELLEDGVVKASELVTDEDPLVRAAAAKYGTPKDIDVLIDAPDGENDPDVQQEIVRQGTREQIDRLISTGENVEDNTIGEFGDHSLTSKLVDSEHWSARQFVAIYGTDEERDKLVNDESSDVRLMVAQMGNDKQRDQLLGDESSMVRAYVAQMGNSWQQDQLIDDSDTNVRAYVAEFGDDSHRYKLMNDKNDYVKMMCARNGSDEIRGEMVKSGYLKYDYAGNIVKNA